MKVKLPKKRFERPLAPRISPPSWCQKGDYDSEKALLNRLEQYDQIDYAMGLSNIEAMDGYTLTDALTPRQFAEMTDLDYEVVCLLYTAYAAQKRELRPNCRWN